MSPAILGQSDNPNLRPRILLRMHPAIVRSFDNSYLIHRVRSYYDYQKHYLPPSRISPPLLSTGESRARALRNTRRERQWGRRERQQREEADQLERAIARRRWICHHDLYAKHVASNPYTRYRPFPTPAQFAASPDLISRMTTFLRRELHVWPNLDVEFLTTFTISLMKAIDIRAQSAVKLLSEFLDLDAPYVEGGRYVNVEHFVHEIYCYLRSPYRDLNTYDAPVQYDTPPDIPPPQEMEMESDSRWIGESLRRSRSPVSPARQSRSRSDSRYRSPTPSSSLSNLDVFYANPLRGTKADWLNKQLKPWEAFSRGDVSYTDVPGQHYTLMDFNHVPGFQKIFRSRLEARGL
ncbi:hypothetical protein BU15DRAFT_80116 [Melanogaster broomeanus]|nr:hypothetical protein BU15DRAFT_80116 [Melanogaster broomeanus]